MIFDLFYKLLQNSFVGHYFGGYFYMGGERFDTMRPDAYLFGENEDLNFLGNKPAPVIFLAIL